MRQIELSPAVWVEIEPDCFGHADLAVRRPMEAHRELLAAEFRERPPHTTAEACERIEQLTISDLLRKVAALEVPEKSRVEFAAPTVLRRLPASDRQVPRRTRHHASLKDRPLDDTPLSGVRKCINAGKVKYRSSDPF